MTKKFKVGEYGQGLMWRMIYDNGDIVTDLDQADSIKIVMRLNDTVIENDMTLVDATQGLIKWTIPEGAFNGPGIAYFEVEAKYSNRNDITNTFKEVIKSRIKGD